MRVLQEDEIEAKALADIIADAAAEKKARDLVFLDVAELVGYTDIFVLCTARNARQVRAIADAVRAVMKADHQLLPIGVEGMESGRWVLVDFDDVVLHIFDEASRAFYDLEGLWEDAPRLEAPEGLDVDEEPLFSLP